MIGVAMVAGSTHGEPGFMTIQEWFWMQEEVDKANKKRAKEQDERKVKK